MYSENKSKSSLSPPHKETRPQLNHTSKVKIQKHTPTPTCFILVASYLPHPHIRLFFLSSSPNTLMRTAYSLTRLTFCTSTLIHPSSSCALTGIPWNPSHFAATSRSASAWLPAVKDALLGVHASSGSTLRIWERVPSAYTIVHVTRQDASFLACCVLTLNWYLLPGHSVTAWLTSSSRPAAADLNCAIVPLPSGAETLSSVMLGSLESVSQPVTLPSELWAKSGLRTMLPVRLQAASRW